MDSFLAEAGVSGARACYLNGLLRLRAGKPTEASALFERALRDRPADQDIRRGLIRALLASEQYAALLDHAAAALAQMPDDAETHFAQGTALAALHQPQAAKFALTRAVALRPSLAVGWLNLGNVCVDLDERTEAERHYRAAIRLNPELAQAHARLGRLLLDVRRIAEATEACEVAVRLAPGLAEAHWNLASALLLSGDMQRGLREYEWRKRLPAFHAAFPPLAGPYWSGGNPAGKVILIRTEPDHGDTIQFARYARKIAEMGGTPILQCDPALASLLGSIPGTVVLPRSAAIEGYDAWIDMMSLPLALGGIPYPEGYLPPVPRPATARAVRIGVDGAGIPTEALAPLQALPDITFVNLPTGSPDLSATAALIETLDLTITTDGPVVHLAGAMGAPVWVLLPHVPHWRWQLGRTDSDWYASARLFRQGAPGEWPGVIRDVITALDQKRSSP